MRETYPAGFGHCEDEKGEHAACVAPASLTPVVTATATKDSPDTHADESDFALAFASKGWPLGTDDSSGRDVSGAGGGGSWTEGVAGTSRVGTATRASASGFVGGATTAGADSATAAGLGFGSSMGTVSSLAFFARAALNASSFARPFAAAADLPAMASQARRGHRRRAVPACVHPRAPPSGEGQAWGPDDIVVETRANIASARGSPKPRGKHAT